MSFVVDPEGLQARGLAIESTAGGAAADLARLRPRIDATTSVPFGSDDVAAAVYRQLTTLTGEALELVRAAAARSGSGVRRMGDAYARADEAVSAGLSTLGGSP